MKDNTEILVNKKDNQQSEEASPKREKPSSLKERAEFPLILETPRWGLPTGDHYGAIG